MYKIIVIISLSLVLINYSSFSQKGGSEKGKYLLSLGMGIDYGSNPSYTDYLKNLLSISSTDSIKTFSVGVEFFGGLEYRFSKSASVKLDYSYYLKSNRYTVSVYVFDFTVTSHQPYLMAYYRLQNNNINLKLGAGAGYHFHMLENTSAGSTSYKGSGVSFRGEIVFAPKFSKVLETYISGFVFGTTSSSLKDKNGNILKESFTGKEVNLGGYGVGARLGLSIYLN